MKSREWKACVSFAPSVKVLREIAPEFSSALAGREKNKKFVPDPADFLCDKFKKNRNAKKA